MNTITRTDIEDVLIFEPAIYRDNRGYFFETFNSEEFQSIFKTFKLENINFKIYQVNQSKSKKGVIRGLHYQNPPFTQSKLIQVIKGNILDVIVDIRTDSPTFGQYYSIELNGTNKKQLFIPKGFAHGFITLSKDAIFQYYVDKPYAPHYDSGIRFDDKILNINWKLKRNLIVSDKDRGLKAFNEITFCTKAEYNYEPIELDNYDQNATP
jgi:dTDP-4-dehydrorhamnose 3,5-epimerase